MSSNVKLIRTDMIRVLDEADKCAVCVRMPVV